MTCMHSENKWLLVEEAWRGELLPVGHCIFVESQLWFVVEVFGAGCVVWAALPKECEQPFSHCQWEWTGWSGCCV